MNLNRLILGLFLMLLTSCKQELKVIFPENVVEIETYIKSYEYIVIIYIKSEGCSLCTMSNLNPWKLYKKVLDKNNTNVLLVINNTNEQNIIEILKSL
jgi:hypothetical protein